jgi:DNA helicase-2/ATP-dependent DNA helicase PcrA
MAHGTGRMPADLLSDLTPAQVEGVTHFGGPLLVLAGAGSGKTRVITRRVAWLLQQGVPSRSILAITFTNKAAGEMRQRVEALVPGCSVWICTFHSFGARLLRIYADRLQLDRNFTIFDQDDRKKVLKDAVEAGLEYESKFTPDQIGGAISKAKNQLITPSQYAAKSHDFFAETVARVYPVYERKLRAANAVDFDDLLLIPALALRNNPELRSELDARFRFLVIDEYQDTNTAQYEVARRLSVDHPNIFVVGDPDQSIYGWRGADLRNILDFERDFPNAKVIALEKNYRSTKAILHAASALIDHNRERKKKSLVTDNPEGKPVRVVQYNDGLEEADQTAVAIRSAVRAGDRKYRDFAVFLRTNALSRTLESKFISYGVPYQVVRGLAFYERKENKDILAYLRLISNPQDDVAFLRIVNEPARGIGKVSLEHLRKHAEPRSLSLLQAAGEVNKIPQIKGKAATGLIQFAATIASLRTMNDHAPDEIVREVLDRTGYRDMLRQSADEADHERLENIEELITAAGQFAREDSSATLTDFLASVALSSDVDGWNENQDCVSVMTLHSAKGLEFPVVHILAVEQGMLPHIRSLEREQDVEEERRLCFVGMTRAKEELVLSHTRCREFAGQTRYCIASDFIRELPPEVESIDHSFAGSGQAAARYWRGDDNEWMEPGHVAPRKVRVDEQGFAVGMIVNHGQYGNGKITQLSGVGPFRKLRVMFARGGEKVFAGSNIKLTVVHDD